MSDPTTPQPSEASPAASAGPATNTAAAHAAKLLEEAEAAIHGLDNIASQAADPRPAPFRLEDLIGEDGPPEKVSMDLLSDVDLDLKIELGRTRMQLDEVLKLRRGSIVALDKLAGDPVDIYVNGRMVARGEILVLNDNFCVRVAQLVGSDLISDKNP
jgi:flagellar motor switch protein FliN